MSTQTYTVWLGLSVSGLLLSAVLIVWRRSLRTLIRLLAVQGVALAGIPLVSGWHRGDWTLIAVGIEVLVLRAGVLPALMRRLLLRDDAVRETEPVVNTTASLLAVAALTILAYAVSRPVVALDPSAASRSTPAALAVVLTGIFVMVARRRALSQVVGFVLVDNGITAIAFLTTAGVPLIVELGASLDIVFAVLVLQILAGRLRIAFGGTDLDGLRELRD